MPRSYSRDSYGSRSSSSGRSSRSTSPSNTSTHMKDVRARSRKRGAHSAPEEQSSSSRRSESRQQSGAAAYSRYTRTNGPQDPGMENPYSRRMAAQTVSRQASARRSRRLKIVAGCLVGILVLVLVGVGVAFAYVNIINGNLRANMDEEALAALEKTEGNTDPFYMLLMGTDGSAERESSGDFGDSFRSDSMMLVRVDPREKKVAVISLMRDTKIDMGEHGVQKLNVAHAFGGAAYTIETVSKLAGVPISHYAEINFDGFREIVDALGGIEVDVAVEINDEDAGGHLDAGVQTINGEQALILCRSRHNYDDIGSGDAYRAANQRMVIAAICKKILDSDPTTMVSTIEALSRYVTTDMDAGLIINLAGALRGINMEQDFYTAVEPVTSEYSGGIWWDILDKKAWTIMMDRVNQGLPPTAESVIDPITGIVMSDAGGATVGADGSQNTARSRSKRSGKVSVRNGCGVSGVGAEAAEAIKELGYTTEAGNANRDDYLETVVVYNKDSQAEDAQEIVDLLGRGRAVKNENEYIFNSDFLVVIGKDWVSAGQATE